MLGQDKMINIIKAVPGIKPNLWVLSFLSADEKRTEKVFCFRSKEGCIKHINAVMESYKEYGMTPAPFCIEEYYTSDCNYLYAVVTTHTTIISGDAPLVRQEDRIDVERVIAFSKPTLDYHNLLGIERSLAANKDINITMEAIKE